MDKYILKWWRIFIRTQKLQETLQKAPNQFSKVVILEFQKLIGRFHFVKNNL